MIVDLVQPAYKHIIFSLLIIIRQLTLLASEGCGGEAGTGGGG